MSRYAELFRAMYQSGPDRAGAERSPAPPDYAAFRILLVDDEPSVLKALRRVFHDEACEVLVANDARQALLLLETEPVQLVISDQRMPGMSGAELLREVKQHWPATQRIMLTGFADVAELMKVIDEVGVFKFITKPWNDDDLRLTARLAFRQYQLQLENQQLREKNRHQQTKLKDLSTLLYDNCAAQTNLLQKAGLLSADQLQQAQAAQSAEESLLDCLLRLQIINESALQRAFAQQLNLPLADLDNAPPTSEMIALLPFDLCQRGRLVPLKLEGRWLQLAMADPSDLLLREHIELLTGLQLRPQVASRSAIENWLNKVMPADSAGLPAAAAAPVPAPWPPARPQIPQLQAGLAALRQGLECVEDALQALSAKQPHCPLCGATIETEDAGQSF